MEISKEHIFIWLNKMNEKIQHKKTFLTELDQAIGDGDHGINMARGFQEVIKKLNQSPKNVDDIGKILQEVGMILISKVGGAAGPLFGSAFMRMGIICKGKHSIDINDLAYAFREAVNAIKARGKAELKDKTMLDIWEPFASFLESSNKRFSYADFHQLMEEKLVEIKQLQAKRGRASFLGSRSIGHFDPGSYSSFYLFDALCITIDENQMK